MGGPAGDLAGSVEGGSSDETPRNGDADETLDRFFESYFRHRPVNATFIGVHEHDGLWPDCSESGLGDLQADSSDQLAALEAAAGDASDWHTGLDLRLASGHLRIQLQELDALHFQRGNPSWYTGEAAFGIISLFLTDYGPLTGRVESAAARLSRLGGFLGQARANLVASPGAWTERAIRECRGLGTLLDGGLDRLLADLPPGSVPNPVRKRFAAARESAVRAAADFADFLNGLPTAPDHGASAGGEGLSTYLRHGHFLDEDATEILRYAEDELRRAGLELEAHDPEEDRREVEARRPGAGEYYARYQEIWDQVRQTAESRELLTWPEFPIRYVPRPHWVRDAAPDLYFLFYRAPAALGRPPVHDYLVTPLPDDLGADEEDALLRAHNDAVIKLNHVIHHGSIGHHVQNWHAYRSRSRVGRIAAVDCASRIAMFCGGTMAEGWACYATDLMKEVGFLSPLEERVELRSRVRMCARAVVDVRLHRGEMSIDEASEYYRVMAGMSPAQARGEAVKNSMFPGAALMYLVGTDRIHRLRETMEQIQGEGFSLRSFHDEFLSYGSVPVSLVAERMIGEAS